MNTDLVNLPSATQLISGVATTSSPFFSELLPIGLFAVGILIGAIIVVALMEWIMHAMERMSHPKNRYD